MASGIRVSTARTRRQSRPAKQRFELGMAQRHQPVLDAGPGEGVLFQSLVGHHHAAAIPVDQLDTSINVLTDGDRMHFGAPNDVSGVRAC